MTSLYNRIGKGYDDTRAADPSIVDGLERQLDAILTGTYLDVACGTGNYTSALLERGMALTGIDASKRMLSKAQSKHPSGIWIEALAHDLPFDDRTFSGALCTLAIHHFGDLTEVFSEVYRVVNHGRFVVFTSDPEQMASYWLNHYFPTLMANSCEQMPALSEVTQALAAAGFQNIKNTPWRTPVQPVDHFLYCGKHQPHLYLDPHIRNGISSFSDDSLAAEVEEGLGQLERDIKTGDHVKIAETYSNDLGDYTFVTGTKV